MRELFVNAGGRVRSGWVLAVFAAPAAFLMGLTGLFAGLLQVNPDRLDDWRLVLGTLATCLAAGVPTVLCALFFKEQVGLADRAWLRQLGGGVAAGGVFLAAVVGVPALLGHGTLQWSALPLSTLAVGGVQQLITLGPAAFGEELLLRGVPLRALARGIHPVVAVGATGAVFGLAHLSNPNATLIAAADIALVGWLFGTIAIRSGSLWLSTGLHLAWNWFEGFVFGQPVSGLQPGRALFAATWERAGFWSGGDFGPEASGWMAVLLVLALGVALVWPARGDIPRTTNLDAP